MTHSGLTILVVEDSQVQAEMLRRRLLDAGYSVEIARNGVEGLQKAHEIRPAVIISDINMPLMDGYALCSAIRAEEVLAGTPVILVTTLSDPGYVLRGLQANADAYLTKPYNANALISWIGNLLSRPPTAATDRRKTEVWIHGESHPVQITPQRMVNLLVSIYENSLLQYRELQETQAQLEELNTSLESRVSEQTVAIRGSERRLRALLQHGEGLVLIVDPAGTMTFVGPTVERMLGLRADELLGRRFIGFAHPDDRGMFAKMLTDLQLQPDKVIHFELRCLSSNGSWVDLDLSARNVVSDPSVGGYVLNLRDISLQKKDEAHIRKLSMAVEQSPAMIVIADAKGNIEYANEAYVRTTGYSREELIGHNPRMMQSGKTPPETYQALWHRVTEGRSWQGEFINQRKDGTEFTVAVQVSPIRDAEGRVTQFLGVQEDITEKRRIESELENYRFHLEELVVSRTKDLNAARQRAESANRAKSEFLASMSHEIRTPMNAVIGLTHLLRMRVHEAEKIGMLDQIAKAGTHLLSVINNVLDQAKIEAGKLLLLEQPIDIRDILSSVVGMLSETVAEKAIHLKTEVGTCSPRMIGDRTRLTQCLLNLTNNAVRHTVAGSVLLRASLLADEETRQLVKFEVVDTGIGIEADVLARLFEPFEQGATIHKGSPSTGLGLVITRRLAQLMGGDAGATSTPLVGSTFWFTAWLRKADADSGLPDPAPRHVSAETLRAHTKGKRVLLVDDHPLNRMVGRQLLELAGIAVTEAVNGLDAINAVRSAGDSPCSLILMDMEMPVMGGIEATRQIRSLECGKNVPIVAMTANAFGEDREACIAAGMNDHVAKPVEPEVLYAKLVQWLGIDSLDSFPLAQPVSMTRAEVTIPPSGTGIDLARLTTLTAGNEDALRGMLRQFFTHHEGDLESIESCLAVGNCKAAFHIAHAVKGSAGQIGAVNLQLAAAAIERPLRNGEIPTAVDLTDFADSLKEVLGHVTAWIRAHPEADVEPMADTDSWRVQVRQLADMLGAVDGNAIAFAEGLARVMPTSVPPDDRTAFLAILETVRRIDLQTAAGELAAFLPRLDSMK